MIRRNLLAFHLDLLTLVTGQRLGICDQPELAVFRDQDFSILANPTGDLDGSSCAGLVAVVVLTYGGYRQQELARNPRTSFFIENTPWRGLKLLYGNDKSREHEVKPENQIIRIRNFAAQQLACRDAAM